MRRQTHGSNFDPLHNFNENLAQRVVLAVFIWVHDFLSHLAFAAICERIFRPRAVARAVPPFKPPERLPATPAEWFFFTSDGFVVGASPLNSRMMRCLRSFGSRGPVVERPSITALTVRRGLSDVKMWKVKPRLIPREDA